MECQCNVLIAESGKRDADEICQKSRALVQPFVQNAHPDFKNHSIDRSNFAPGGESTLGGGQVVPNSPGGSHMRNNWMIPRNTLLPLCPEKFGWKTAFPKKHVTVHFLKQGGGQLLPTRRVGLVVTNHNRTATLSDPLWGVNSGSKITRKQKNRPKTDWTHKGLERSPGWCKM